MNILLVGGGSGGPVMPLLAVAEKIKQTHPKIKFLLVGTKTGPEKLMSEHSAIAFTHIAAGKFRRYFSWKNLVSIPLIIVGFFQALKIIKDFKPDCVFGAGSFVQVPVVWAAWFKGVPVILHQQDVRVSLANRLCQFLAKKITVTFEHTQQSFASTLGIFYKKNRSDKVILTGNPFREQLKNGSKNKAEQEFNLKSDLPTLLVLGGGTGAEFLNNLIIEVAPLLTKTVQIIHSTGQGKFNTLVLENYHPYEFISNMGDAYVAADIVVARAGLSTITELSNLEKLSIIVPMPETHQEVNAEVLAASQAAIVLKQHKITDANFISLIRRLLFATDIQGILKSNITKIMPKNATEKIAAIILEQASH